MVVFTIVSVIIGSSLTITCNVVFSIKIIDLSVIAGDGKPQRVAAVKRAAVFSSSEGKLSNNKILTM
jgi:hypothetical protein